MTLPKHKKHETAHPQRMTGELRRWQLVEAAVKLFSQKGYSGITTREIAELTDMSEANIFRHFPSKDALYASVFEIKAQEIKAFDASGKLREIAAHGTDDEIIRAVIRAVLDYFRCYREVLRMVMLGTLEGHLQATQFIKDEMEPLRVFLTQYIIRRQKDKAFRACNVRATVRAILAMPSQHALMTNLFEIGEYDVTDVEAIETFTQLALRALTLPNTKEFINEDENNNV